ncbi:OLC1v1004676C1 [Oldenlandia corymbosa var. corymbosa]|uniref:OLC1v1004676C1 n=1 Tax=Oldenlandia corymbosa var. corymbosa TaxID=529605 RepID=A0AAV1DDL8_OLDCO|nr:OLC1v1004676C1 [Oldenlandia corymbosa var. corymbosa]
MICCVVVMMTCCQEPPNDDAGGGGGEPVTTGGQNSVHHDHNRVSAPRPEQPAAAATIQQQPTSTAGGPSPVTAKVVVYDVFDNYECSICLSTGGSSRGRTLPIKWMVLQGCGHRFHVDCLSVWMSVHKTCPLCRAEQRSDPANFQDLHSQLVSYKLHLKAQQPVNPATADVAQSSSSHSTRGGRGFQHGNGRGNRGGRGGRRGSFIAPSTPGMSCQLCGYQNHTVATC